MAIFKGQNGIQTTVLLSFIGIPFGIYICWQSGILSIPAILGIGTGIIIYGFILALMTMRLPEKHRKAVAGKNFLDMEIYRNKEESDSFLFGVAFHEELMISDTEGKMIEEDPNFIEIKQSCILESEKALLEYELERREQKELLEDANLETLEDTVETEPGEAHEQIRNMEDEIIKEMNEHVDKEMETIKDILRKTEETIESLSKKTDSLTGDQAKILEQVDRLSSMKPTYEKSEKNMTEMGIGEIQFRLTTLDQCEQAMNMLSYDDMVHALQYRLFQVRRIFKKLFSENVKIELLTNYQPQTYFNTGREFERFLLVMRRAYGDEFKFKEMMVDHEHYPVNVQCAKCVSVVAGWVNSKIPIFLVIHSPADAHAKIDIVQNAKQLKDLKERILSRLLNLYKMENEQNDYALEEERSLSNMFIMKYDELKQKLEEIDYQPEEPEAVERERVVKIIPPSIKAYSVVATMLWLIFCVSTIILAGK